MASKTKSPKKYSILAYVHLNGPCTAKQIAYGLHFKRNTVRTLLTKLFCEAEVDYNKYFQKKNEEREWVTEQEWCEQKSILFGIFMTKKEYNDFKKSDAFKEYLELIKDKPIHKEEFQELSQK